MPGREDAKKTRRVEPIGHYRCTCLLVLFVPSVGCRVYGGTRCGDWVVRSSGGVGSVVEQDDVQTTCISDREVEVV